MELCLNKQIKKLIQSIHYKLHFIRVILHIITTTTVITIAPAYILPGGIDYCNFLPFTCTHQVFLSYKLYNIIL